MVQRPGAVTLGRLPGGVRVVDGRPADTSAASTNTDARIPGTGLLFCGYLVLLADSYLGVSREIPILNAAHAPTLLAWSLFLSVLFKVGYRAFGEFRQSALLTGLVVFTAVSVVYAYVQMSAYEAFRVQLDNLMLFVATVYLVDRPSRIKKLGFVSAAMIVILVARNVDKLGASSRVSGFASGYFMNDGNDFAWGLIVLLTPALFLMLDKNRLPLRLIGGVAALGVVFGVVGTQSRGASLALAAAGLFYLAFMARRKFLGAVFLATVVVVGLALAPGEYMGRMQSIATYEEDNSAQGRLEAWTIAIRMALDHPFGVGADNFNSAYGRVYLPAQSDSRLTWGQARWLSPHSIYFRALGEYGVPGLILLLTIVFTNLVDNIRLRKTLSQVPEPRGISPVLPGVVTMGVIGHAVSGVFLGGLTYPHLYLLSGLTASLRRQAGVRAPVDVRAPAVLPVQPAAVLTRAGPDRPRIGSAALSNEQRPARHGVRPLRAR